MTYHLILGYEIIRLKDKMKRKIESSKEKKMLNVENVCTYICYAQHIEYEFTHFEDFSYSSKNLIRMDNGKKKLCMSEKKFIEI
jgi:hypothetical protein